MREFPADLYTTQPELMSLFGETAAWLVENGEYSLDSSERVLGTYKGFPLIDGSGPQYDFALSSAAIRQIVPDAANRLEVGDKLELTFFEPCYLANPLQRIDPNCCMTILKTPEANLVEESIFLNSETEPHRITLDYLRVARSIGSAIAQEISDVVPKITPDRLALSRLVYVPLKEIVARLDDIKAASGK